MQKDRSNKITLADGEYVHAVFDALMNFQAIEDLLKRCILASYDILTKTSPEGVSFHPSKKDITDIKTKLGLGGLIVKFEAVTPNKDICRKLEKTTRIRNDLAHRAAANYLKFPISSSGADQCLLEAKEFKKAGESANLLYYKLLEVHERIMHTHGEVI